MNKSEERVLQYIHLFQNPVPTQSMAIMFFSSIFARVNYELANEDACYF